jgi:hypothetical protein
MEPGKRSGRTTRTLRACGIGGLVAAAALLVACEQTDLASESAQGTPSNAASAASAATVSDGSTLGVADRTNANVSLAVEGRFVAAVWSAAAASGETDVFAAVSQDSGQTFSTPTRVNVTAGEVNVNGEQPPRVALRARHEPTPDIAVVWTAKGPNGTRLISATSDDGGRTLTNDAVPGTDAPGNRGWEALGVGPGGRYFSVWLDHRNLAPAQQTQTAVAHQHGAHGEGSSAEAGDGVAMAQLSQLYVASLDGTVAPRGVTGGVCYCCKTAVAKGAGDTLYLAWRHVYPGNMRDIAFTVSRDGGKTFAAPVRVSEDKWQINGCPDDGPAMVVDSAGAVHVVWPSVVTEEGAPVKALFHAMTRDGRTFSTRDRIPTRGQANHPQLAIDSADTLAVTWDESGSGSRTLAAATGRIEAGNRVEFSRVAGDGPIGTYPDLVAVGPGAFLRASTTAGTGPSQIRLDRIR